MDKIIRIFLMRALCGILINEVNQFFSYSCFLVRRASSSEP